MYKPWRPAIFQNAADFTFSYLGLFLSSSFVRMRAGNENNGRSWIWKHEGAWTLEAIYSHLCNYFAWGEVDSK